MSRLPLLVFLTAGASVGVAMASSGCGGAETAAHEDESRANGVDCDVSLTALHDERLAGIEISDPTPFRIRQRERFRHLNELSRFGDASLTVLRTGRVPVRLTAGSIVEFSEFAYLRGQVPPGWEATGLTWDSVPGTGNETGIYLGDSGKPNNAWSLALHEATHSVDLSIGFSEKSLRLKALYTAELTRSPIATDVNATYRRSNIREFLAVAVDEFSCSAATRASLAARYPAMTAFLEHEYDDELLRVMRHIPADGGAP